MKPFLAILMLCLAACSSLPTPAERTQLADDLAASHKWQAFDIDGGSFLVRAYLPTATLTTDELAIYIEGDGLAWISSTRPAEDPTPRDPLALRLALAQPEGQAAYLARPCQYLAGDNTNCRQTYWTSGRFAPEVVTTMNSAIDRIKQRFSARRLTLIGYSGGGAVAALIASRRNDVVRLVTVAGNLDHQAWSKRHRLTPLDASLNPLDVAVTLSGIAQWHLVGRLDTNITPDLATSFIRRSGAPASALQVIDGFDHHCCWAEHWPKLWRGRAAIQAEH